MPKSNKKLKLIPLGGMGEIAKNIFVFEYDKDIIVVDCGIAFPEDEMLGVDLVIPDVTYLLKKRNKVRGIVLTHGHEDHIGALPYVLKELNVPVYGTNLTLGLLEYKLEEHAMLKNTVRHRIKHGDLLELGKFKVEVIRSTHSIADSVALAIHSPVGTVIYTSDFKIDYTPIEGEPMDLSRFAELGKKGVLLMLCDSTNVEREGYTMSEKTVGYAFEGIFENASGRILVATFASNVHRIQQVINASLKFGRKVAVCGRSVINVMNAAINLGYMNIPENILVDIDEINNYPNEELAIITTGSQGEPMSALSRMAVSAHRKVEIVPGDLVVISATPIPGNEKLVSGVINELFKKGADVIYETLADIHVSGHACQEELKLIHNLVKPKFFTPVHGEYRHLKQHAILANTLGTPKENIFILQNGKVLELSSDEAKVAGSVTSGKILVDGLGIGDVGNIVLKDRRLLSQDGLIIIVITIDGRTDSIIADPDVISRGFVYVRESEDLLEQVKEKSREALENYKGKNKKDWNIKKSVIKYTLRNFLYEKTKRKPMILPIIVEV